MEAIVQKFCSIYNLFLKRVDVVEKATDLLTFFFDQYLFDHNELEKLTDVGFTNLLTVYVKCL